MKQFFTNPKKCTLTSIISLIIISFSFLMSLVSIYGVYYIPTFLGWYPLAITFIVLFVLAFITTFVINVMLFKYRNNIVINTQVVDNNKSNIKTELEEVKVQINE